jgi:hypothetical protein
MKKTVALLALAFSASTHAEDLLSSIRSCSAYSSAGDFVTSVSTRTTPNIVRDGISYFKPRAGLTIEGNAVLAVFAYGNGLPGSSSDPAFGYGVVVEGTTAFGETLIAGSAASANASQIRLDDHEFVEIGCYK